jgi:hypothetical protein
MPPLELDLEERYTPRTRWGLAEATPMAFSTPPTIDEVDMFYRQLIEIHAIGAMQLAECVHWRHSYSTPSLVWVRTNQ